MNPYVVDVEAKNNYILKLTFENQEIKEFDASPFIDKGIFKELKDFNYFNRVKVAFGAIEWPNEQDFSNDTLYLLGTTSSS